MVEEEEEGGIMTDLHAHEEAMVDEERTGEGIEDRGERGGGYTCREREKRWEMGRGGRRQMEKGREGEGADKGIRKGWLI